jgi:ABC-type phosphate transport system substrate-binding protein
MDIRRNFNKLTLTAVMLLCSSSLSVADELEPNGMASADDNEIVIVSPSNKSEFLTLNQLRAIFSLRAREWPNGTGITVVVLKDQEKVHKEFLVKTLKMLPHQLRRQWDRFIYSGIGQGPVVVGSQNEMVNKVNSIPGAIGYIEGGVPHETVTTISIR